MSQSELRKAIEASEKSFWHPLVVGIAATSSSPTQALEQAKNRGLSNEEQTWCRLLAKAMRIARENGMDALSILPQNLTTMEISMSEIDISFRIKMLKNLIESHSCKTPNNVPEGELYELIKIISSLNNDFTNEFGFVDIPTVEKYVNSGIIESIYLLIGDERKEAKEFLLSCISQDERRELFYSKNFHDKYIKCPGEVCKITIGPFICLASGLIDGLVVESGEWFDYNILPFGEYFYYYNHDAPHDDKFSIVRDLASIVRDCGISLSKNKNFANDIYRAMIFEYPGRTECSQILEISISDIRDAKVIKTDISSNRYILIENSNISSSLTNHPGYIEINKHFEMAQGEIHIIISDPENLQRRIANWFPEKE